MCKKVIYFIFIVFFICEITEIKAAAETNTTKAAEPVITTTEKPKIKVIDSDLCKKCLCNVEDKVLNCTYQGMNNLFTDVEWEILINGDVTFDIIRLQHNNITTIDGFPEYPVKQLYFSFNQLTKIANGAFKNLTKLEKLDLSHNKLTSKALKPEVFEGKYSPTSYEPLNNLMELDLGYNDIHNLDSDLFEHIPNLQSLYLSNNVFKMIDHSTVIAISSLKSLKTLDMSFMEIKELPGSMLYAPRELETLIITGNLFTEIPDSLHLCANLKKLVLDENPIEDLIDENVFPKLLNLEYLSISYIYKMKRIGKGAFSNLQNLTTLILANNARLEFIHYAAFARKTINRVIFDYPPIEKLYLHNNNLTTLDNALFERWDKMKTIDLRFNPWSCDCRNKWLIQSLILQINSTTPAFARDVTCASPIAWQNMKLLDMTEKKKILICKNENYPENDQSILLGALIGILIGIPLAICAMVLYQKRCCGLFKSKSTTRGKAIYNRASFSDDFHI